MRELNEKHDVCIDYILKRLDLRDEYIYNESLLKNGEVDEMYIDFIKQYQTSLLNNIKMITDAIETWHIIIDPTLFIELDDQCIEVCEWVIFYMEGDVVKYQFDGDQFEQADGRWDMLIDILRRLRSEIKPTFNITG